MTATPKTALDDLGLEVEFTSHSLTHIKRAVCQVPWAILPAKLEEMLAFLEIRLVGQRFSAAEIQGRVGTGKEQPLSQIIGRIGVLPVAGVLMPRANMLTQISGGTSTRMLTSEFRALAANPDVDGILLNIDSPGGAVYGIEEFAQEIMTARAAKPVWAVANEMAASAAYWLGSQATKLLATPSGDVGSVGVYAVHEDWSKAEEASGIKTTYISAGKYKTIANESEPLSDEGRAVIQQHVNETYDQFVEAVARGRGLTASDVKAGYGEGRLIHAAAAKRMGMVDGIATLEQALSMMQREIGSAVSGQRQVAESQTPAVEAVSAAEPAPERASTNAKTLRLRNETRRLT